MKKVLVSLLVICMMISMSSVFAKTESNNGDWSKQNVTLKNTSEAELMVRVGDIDALNDESSVDDSGYDPFTAVSQYSHGYPWVKDANDTKGTDSIFVGTNYKGESSDGYSSFFNLYKDGEDAESAYTDGALEIAMNYDASGLNVKNAILQLCVDDFQAVSFDSNFTVKLNGKDAPFIAELLNHIDQTGPTSYIVSAIIPSNFYSDISSGKLVITINETTGVGDGYAIDFAKLLVNYNNNIFTGKFTGKTTAGATVRLLGTATTVVASQNGGFEFEAIPGLNAIRASKDGYVEGYDFGIVFIGNVQSEDEEKWFPNIELIQGQGNPDIDFSQFGTTNAWENASAWATKELEEADKLGLIPDSLKNGDLTKSITREEFAEVSVKAYEALTGKKAAPVANNPFVDTKNTEVLKAYNLGITTGTSATTFEPNALLNREQAATMLTRTYKKATIDGWTIADDSKFPLEYTKSNTFADDKDISSWAKDSVYFMNANGIINGVGDNKFAPKNTTSAEEAVGYANATREQAIIIATRMVKNLK